MRRQRGLVGLMGLAALVGLGLAKPVAAAVTTEQSASILVFPKVISDGSRDTIIQITNTSNNMRFAHCFYVNGALTSPDLPPSFTNPPLWTEIDFDILLTKQQPTHWVVSTGRRDYPLDKTCRQKTCVPSTTGGPAIGNTSPADCCDAGFDPGRVPPVHPGFTGELKCIETDSGGFPVPGNALKGEATLEDIATADVSKYNAVGLKGFDTLNVDLVLCLGGPVDIDHGCPNGAEYEACPATWILDHPARNAPDRVVDQQTFCTTPSCSTVSTNLTVVPCSEPFETQNPPPVTLQFTVTNEYEETFSASTTFTCWASYDLGDPGPFGTGGISDIFNTATVGGEILQTKMRSAAATAHGVVPVLEETHTDLTHTYVARAARNAHSLFQDQAASDIITIPEGQGGDVP
jgi:hypothetical protein